MKAISVLGSTGSIGTQTLQITEEFPDQFRVVALTAGRNLALLVQQIKQHQPELVALADETLLPELKQRLDTLHPSERPAKSPQLVGGTEGLDLAASWGSADLVVTGIVGCAGLLPTLAAIRAGKDLALANKETLIAAGPVVLPELKKSGSRLLPADSEHSAIFQCLQGTPWAETARLSTGIPTPGLRRIQLTASGGAFRDWDAADLRKATVAAATSHPNWNMGQKITVDSASLMNKGLEVIEAHYLFGLDYDRIEIVIHPQSIIHSMVELVDSSMLAQLGWPDMRLPILYCLSWPSRLETPWQRLNLTEVGQLTFHTPDPAKYPCMELAYATGQVGGTMPAVMNAANEEAVAQFLEERIHFLDIPEVIEATCERHKSDLIAQPRLDDVLSVDRWARTVAREKANLGRKRIPVSTTAAPAYPRVSHHLLICATPNKAKCCVPSSGEACWTALKLGVKTLGLEAPTRPEGIVLRTKADCLRICERGPVLLIWPDGCWYGEVTPERIERILIEHVIGGRPIEEWLIQRSTMWPNQAAAS